MKLNYHQRVHSCLVKCGHYSCELIKKVMCKLTEGIPVQLFGGLYSLTIMMLCSVFSVYAAEIDAVFRVFDLSSLSCHYSLQMSSDWLYSGQLVLDGNHHNCTVTIHADHTEDQRLMVYMTTTKSNFSQHTDNGGTYVQVYEGNSTNPTQMITAFDDQTMSEVHASKGSSITIQTSPYDARDMYNTSVSIIFTAFRKVSFPNLCASSEYRCANDRCIFHSLSCRGHNPCGDNSDCQISIPAIATLAMGGICGCGVIGLLCYILVKNTKDVFNEEFQRQPRKFSPTKAFGSFKSFTPATVTFTPLQRKWSTK